jgi:hypothetical protein
MVLLGSAYKPRTPIETGSSSVLLANIIAAHGHQISIVRNGGELSSCEEFGQPTAFFLGCPDPEFLVMPFPVGSTVIDPWHRIEPAEGIEVVRIGECP